MSNAGDMLAGWANTCSGEYFAISWQPGAPFAPVAFPVATSYSRAHDVNEDGVVVGEVDALSQGARNGFRSQGGKRFFCRPMPVASLPPKR